MTGRMDEGADGSDLPEELWLVIGKTLNTRLDVLRFRGVCKLWRCSIPPPHPKLSFLSIKVPYSLQRRSTCDLVQTIFYRFQHPVAITDASKFPSKSSSLSSGGWLIKVEESKSATMRLLSPFCNRPFRKPPITFPKTLNLLNYRVVELHRSCSLKHEGSSSPYASILKVVLPPNFSSKNVDDSVMVCIDEDGRLGFMKYGDERWTIVDDRKFHYHDIIVYKGQLCVVDRWGGTHGIDVSTLKLTRFSNLLLESGDQKRLVESCGSLYVVDKYYETDPGWRRRLRRGMNFSYFNNHFRYGKVVNFKVYKLDEQLGIWVEMKNLADRAFMLGDDFSFSVSTNELAGCQENSIYFCDIFGARVYSFDYQRIFIPEDLPGSTDWLWPPPSWFKPHPLCSYTLGVE